MAEPTDKFDMPMTQDRWDHVDRAITAFMAQWPRHWLEFQKDLKANRTEYQLANEGDLKKSGFRNTLSFPIIARPRTKEEIELDPIGNQVEFEDSLKVTLEDLMPGFTEPDKPGKPNRLYKAFVRRYSSLFMPGEEF